MKEVRSLILFYGCYYYGYYFTSFSAKTRYKAVQLLYRPYLLYSCFLDEALIRPSVQQHCLPGGRYRRDLRVATAGLSVFGHLNCLDSKQWAAAIVNQSSSGLLQCRAWARLPGSPVPPQIICMCLSIMVKQIIWNKLVMFQFF